MKIYSITIILVLLTLSLIVAVLFLPVSTSYISRLPFSDKINIIALAVNIIGFGLAIYTGWFAAQQFIQSQIKPELYVSFEGNRTSTEMQRFDIARDAPVSIYVNNSGNGVGRFISIYIVFQEGLDVSFDSADQESNRWRLHYNPDKDQYVAHYVGANEFVCYKNFPLYAGKIRVRIESKGGANSYSCEWKALAENMSVKEGKLLIRIINRD